VIRSSPSLLGSSLQSSRPSTTWFEVDRWPHDVEGFKRVAALLESDFDYGELLGVSCSGWQDGRVVVVVVVVVGMLGPALKSNRVLNQHSEGGMQEDNGLDALRRAREQESTGRSPTSKFPPLSRFERGVIFAAAVVMLLLVALHFPFDGYFTTCPSYDPDFTCRNGMDEEGRAPMWYWESRAPLVASLMPFKYFVVWEALVLAVAVAAVLVFGDRWKKPQS